MTYDSIRNQFSNALKMVGIGSAATDWSQSEYLLSYLCLLLECTVYWLSGL